MSLAQVHTGAGTKAVTLLSLRRPLSPLICGRGGGGSGTGALPEKLSGLFCTALPRRLSLKKCPFPGSNSRDKNLFPESPSFYHKAGRKATVLREVLRRKVPSLSGHSPAACRRRAGTGRIRGKDRDKSLQLFRRSSGALFSGPFPFCPTFISLFRVCSVPRLSWTPCLFSEFSRSVFRDFGLSRTFPASFPEFRPFSRFLRRGGRSGAAARGGRCPPAESPPR